MRLEYRHLRWMSLIWDTSLTTKAKVTAAALADHMNSNHDIAWPSMERLSRMTGLSKRSVVRGTQELEEGGWLTIERGGINKGTSRYRPIFPKEIESLMWTESPSTGATMSPASATQSPVLVPQSHPNQSNESVNNNKGGKDRLSKTEKQRIQAELDAIIEKQKVRQC